MENAKAQHILSTSANLFGLCFVVFTYLKANKLDSATYMDECTAFSMCMFIMSCFLSFHFFPYAVIQKDI